MALILASSSSRRKEILSKITSDFKIEVSNVDEQCDIKDPFLKVQEIAKRKGKAIYKLHKNTNDIIISADTMVVVDNIILGKPLDSDDAFYMIKLLQGKSHIVLTGVYIKSKTLETKFVDKSTVYIKEMTNKEIDEYIKTNESLDKAGAYAIQGIFAKYIDHIEGDYYNVMGLPLDKVKEALKNYE